jgi:probable rRNA maturation factor
VEGPAPLRDRPRNPVTRAVYLGSWRIDVTVRDGVAVPPPIAALGRAIAIAADAAGAPSPGSIGLILADDRELAMLNAEHLGQQGPTDVLSFPLWPPATFPPHAGQPKRRDYLARPTAVPAAFALPPGRRRHLGDIVVSVERAVAQAETGRGGQTGNIRWMPADELRLLVTHGTLHLCGWDHADHVEQAAMRALETRLLGRGAEELGVVARGP